jgi:hypothetical protein
MAVRTISMRTRAALGTLAAAMEVAVAVKLSQKERLTEMIINVTKNFLLQLMYLHNGGECSFVERDVVHLRNEDGCDGDE